MTEAAAIPAAPPAQPSPPLAPPQGTPLTARLAQAAGPGRKIAVLAGLLLATIIPISLVADLVDEREQRQKGLQEDFRQSWGPEQSVRTPILVVPVATESERPLYLKLAPSQVSVTAQLAPEDRRRGIFHATVYEARLEMAGRFDPPSAGQLRELLGDDAARLRWDRAAMLVSSAGLSGMKPGDRALWDGQETAWQNCREAMPHPDACTAPGLVVAVPHLTEAPEAGKPLPFQASLTLRGTEALHLLPAARAFEVRLAAPWPTPSFTGTLLPSSSSITADGFTAQWQGIDHTAARLWTAHYLVETHLPASTRLGVDLLEATPTYRMVSRAAKYGLLFVTLSFTAYFLFEMLARIRIHPVQYGLLGLSLCLFPLLLLALSEPLGYPTGYALSALPVLIQASLYTWGVLRKLRSTALFGALLGFLFAFLYVVLSLESYALLMGAVALFAVLSGVMALTRKVDWG